jgi:glycosyltransferase involved in cell wall biosynthesis
VTAAAEASTDTLRRRVLVVHPAMAPYRVDLFNLLARQCDLRVIFLHAVPPYAANLPREELSADLECSWSVVSDGGRSPARALPGRLWREVSSFRPDVLVTHEFGWASVLSMLTPLAGRQAGRILWTTRSTDQFAKLSTARQIAVKTLAPRADALLAYSKEARLSLAAVARMPESSMFVCANHQDAGRLRHQADSTREEVLNECRRRGLADRPLVVTVGRLVEVKDVATTIGGFARARDALGESALVVVGDGPLRGTLELLARDLGVADRVVFMGHVSSAQVQGWLSIAALTVLASLAEPFGAVVAEGLAHGAPCICSSTAGASVLINSPMRGVTVPPGDLGAMEWAFRSRAADLQRATDLAGSRRDDLRPLTVHDDASGFLAAVAYAVGARAARRERGAA